MHSTLDAFTSHKPNDLIELALVTITKAQLLFMHCGWLKGKALGTEDSGKVRTNYVHSHFVLT